MIPTAAQLATRAQKAVQDAYGSKATVRVKSSAETTYDESTGVVTITDTTYSDVDCSPVFPRDGGRSMRGGSVEALDLGVTYVPGKGLQFVPAEDQVWTIEETQYVVQSVETYSTQGTPILYTLTLSKGARASG